MDAIRFPAKLVGYRLDLAHERIVLFDDKPVLWSGADVERRLDMYRGVAASSGIAHTFEVVRLEDLEAMMAAARARLEAELEQMLNRQPDPWDEAVDKAAQLARAHFEGDGPTLKRLPRAVPIAKSQNWLRLGDKYDTWLIPGSKLGVVYKVNGKCTCPDSAYNAPRWCKHRLARALAKKAAELLRSGNGDDSQVATQRIDVVVAHMADESRSLPHTSGCGELVCFKVDGKEAAPPVRSMPVLYRWLQEHEYVPDSFKWLGWERGLRQRRQSYVRR